MFFFSIKKRQKIIKFIESESSSSPHISLRKIKNIKYYSMIYLKKLGISDYTTFYKDLHAVEKLEIIFLIEILKFIRLNENFFQDSTKSTLINNLV